MWPQSGDFQTAFRWIWLNISHEVCCYYGFLVYHIPLCSFGSFFITVYMVVCFVYICLILQIIYSYCYVYVFLLLRMLCSVHSVFIVPTGTLRLPWLRFFRVLSLVVRQMPGYNSQRRGVASTMSDQLTVYCVCVNVYCTTATGCHPNCS
jgi:hypothetical protein